eukprot:9264-Alexandrium_andersonii.AAC.1
MGGSPSMGRAALRECMEEYDQHPQKESLPKMVHALFSPGTSERAQCETFLAASVDSVKLPDFPAIFIVLQEYAACSLDETIIESQHARIKKLLAPTGWMMPAAICAWLRHSFMLDSLHKRGF